MTSYLPQNTNWHDGELSLKILQHSATLFSSVLTTAPLWKKSVKCRI